MNEPANPPPAQLLPVVQADRDRAADNCREGNDAALDIRCGDLDEHPLVQAFAAHRLAHAKEQAAGVEREVVERDIRVAIWNGLRASGLNQEFAQIYIRAIMAEPLMLRALALAPAPASSVGEGLPVCASVSVEQLAEEVVSAANIVSHDGYYEIDIDRVTEVLAKHRAPAPEHGELASLVEALAQEAAFLCARLDELEWGLSMEEFANLHSAHVDPSHSRLKGILQKLSASQGGEGSLDEAVRLLRKMLGQAWLMVDTNQGHAELAQEVDAFVVAHSGDGK